MDDHKKIVIVSDGTGGTARRLMDAVLVQYHQKDLNYSLEKIYQKVRTHKEIDRILGEIDDECLILYSVISRELSDYFHDQLAERDILHLNVLQPMLEIVSKFLGVHPDYRPGLLQKLDNRYYGKIEAIGYTVDHDDGCGSLIEQADAVLLGLSRSCKTPISMFLACNHGLKVANIPIINDDTIMENLLRRLESVHPKKIIGLLMQPGVMTQIREERSNQFAVTAKARSNLEDYFDSRMVSKEYRFCCDLFQVKGWQTIDVTYRAIEEVSKEIMKMLGRPRSNVIL